MSHFLYSIIIYPLIELIEVSFIFFNRICKNPGFAVLGISFIVTLVCLPLYIVAERWQEVERNTQKKLKPGIDRIKAVFTGDEQYMILSSYYKQHQYHPIMALRSSFGLLIQIPFFIAAYIYLSGLPVLKGFSFFFIRDMGAPDSLFRIGSFPVNLLPIAMTVINIIAGAIYTKGFPVKEKVQIYGMALLFLVLLYNSPSGLVLYWTMNNVFSLVKNVFYKLKNPLRSLYLTMCAAIVCVDVYLVAFCGGAEKKRFAAAFLLTLLVLIPLLVRFVQYLLKTCLAPLVQDKRKRLYLFLISIVSLCMLSGIILPATMINSSVAEFSDINGKRSPLYFVYNALLQSTGLFVVWPVCIYFLFHDRIQTLMASFFSVLLFCSVVNAFCFPGFYGSMNNTLFFITGFHEQPKLFLLCNTLVILALVILLTLSFKKFTKIVTSLTLVLFLAFTAFGVYTVHSVRNEYRVYEAKTGESPDTLTPVFHLSKTGRNVVIFMLDRSESAYMPSIFAESPELTDSYSGFTYYPNTVSFNGHTLMGAPAIYGGYESTPLEMNRRKNTTLLEKTNEALLMLPRIFTEQAGYSAVLTDAPWAGFSQIPDMSITKPYPSVTGLNTIRKYTSFWIHQNPDKYGDDRALLGGMTRNFLWTSFFREVPAVLRSFVYYDGKYWGDFEISGIRSMLDSYAVLDFLPQLTDFAPKKENSFTFIDNETTHEDEVLEPPEYEPAKKITRTGSGKYASSAGYSGNAAAFKRIAAWLEFLKKNGVYDNTRIIMVADHGIGFGDAVYDNFETPELYPGYFKDHHHPILFCKDFNAKGKLSVDTAFMTTADVPTLALGGILPAPVNPFTGNPVFTDYKQKHGAVVSISNLHQPMYHKNPNKFTIQDDEWYVIRDNIFLDKNWHKGLEK